MIVDTSAIVALLSGEASAISVAICLSEATAVRMCSTTMVELAMVATSADTLVLEADVNDLLRRLDVEFVPFTAEHAVIARDAHVSYGGRSGSPARLNYGDCMVYAVAKALDEPLLYVGDGFSHTDIVPAVA